VNDGAAARNQYNAMGDAYESVNDGPWNSLYERPATIALLGDVHGKRVLDVGCGPGAMIEWFVANGASVSACDVSEEMVRIAQTRSAGQAHVFVADLTAPLSTLGDGSFDAVNASLVLHYLEHWEPILLEFRRVLAPGGAVVFSTHHPAMDWEASPDNYFAKIRVTNTMKANGREYPVTAWRRPLTSMTEAIAAAGFVIERLVEPEPMAELASVDPRADNLIRTRPRFLFFRLRHSGRP
jgi:ubiquinone/menaquinone biosynthesis C-methylase UbiE